MSDTQLLSISQRVPLRKTWDVPEFFSKKILWVEEELCNFAALKNERRLFKPL